VFKPSPVVWFDVSVQHAFEGIDAGRRRQKRKAQTQSAHFTDVEEHKNFSPAGHVCLVRMSPGAPFFLNFRKEVG
jgi:hypothetical protein